MAPIKIRHIVSYSSQDPKHSVENLLMENSIQPWLSCPQDRSRQLRVELQLDLACPIGYIDIGNSGSAFLQIDVGRSIWPLDKAFIALLPTTTLMSPADSRIMRNHRGVRMFKEGDFLEDAAKEKWDRLRVTCGQPFNKHEQFGLSFIRIRSPLNEEGENRRPAGGGPTLRTSSSIETQAGSSSPVSPPHPREKSTMDVEEPEVWSRIETTLREKLQKTSSLPPACVSRSARMLQLSAAKSRKRSQPITAPPSPPIPLHFGDSPVSSGSCPETLTSRLGPSQKEHVTPRACREQRMAEARRRRRAQTRNSERNLTPKRERDRPSTAQRPPETDTNTCPICAGHFPAGRLLTHAATCGEAPGLHVIALSTSDDDDWNDVWQGPAAPHRPAAAHGPVSWVQCPLCGFRFRDNEIEEHASRCGD
ncbi:protein XNDC1N isoform X1 [Rhinoderma darwinii]|uniref:protein XNDC1N isoform X1 n=1 Tax=Rhinoderma darwinii TaxID=43563 RepID=UPI003F66FF7F